MRVPSGSEMFELGLEIERIGAKLVRGEVVDPAEVVSLLATASVAFTDNVEELRGFLSEASRAREDYFVDLAATAQLGPRPK